MRFDYFLFLVFWLLVIEGWNHLKMHDILFQYFDKKLILSNFQIKQLKIEKS